MRKFYLNGPVIPCQNVNTIRQVVDCATTVPLKVRLLMFFCQNFFEKSQIWTSEPHFGEVRSDAWPWLMVRWKAHVRRSICVNWTFFAIYYGSELWGKMCTAWLFSQGDQSLCTQLLSGRCCPSSTILGIRRLEALAYSAVKIAFFCVSWFWHNTEAWQTERRTDRQSFKYSAHSIYNACKASFAPCKVK